MYSLRLVSEYLGLSSMKEPLVICDYYYAGQGFDDNPKEKYNCQARAIKIHQGLEDLSIGGRDADEYSLAQMAEIGEGRHNIIYDRLLKALLTN